MSEQYKHLVCYDGTCGMCHQAVQFILAHDKGKLFLFAPLQGETAMTLLQDWALINPDADTIVLIENYAHENRRFYDFGKAAFRICWLLGGLWKVPGVISFLPGFLYNWAYRIVAKNRFKWFGTEVCLIPQKEDQKRFLP